MRRADPTWPLEALADVGVERVERLAADLRCCRWCGKSWLPLMGCNESMEDRKGRMKEKLAG